MVNSVILIVLMTNNHFLYDGPFFTIDNKEIHTLRMHQGILQSIRPHIIVCLKAVNNMAHHIIHLNLNFPIETTKDKLAP